MQYRETRAAEDLLSPAILKKEAELGNLRLNYHSNPSFYAIGMERLQRHLATLKHDFRMKTGITWDEFAAARHTMLGGNKC